MAKRERWSPAQRGIALGVVGSMAGNVTWAVTIGSPILVGVGVFMSLLLPAAVTLWRRTPVPEGRLRRVERVFAMTGVCLCAAVYSLVHATLLLHDAGLPWSIAWAPSVGLELFVVMSARASSAEREEETASRRDKRTPQVKPGAARPASSPRPRDTASPASPAPSRSAASASPSTVPADVGERPGPRPVPELPASRPVPVPEPSTDPDDYAHLDEPVPDDESPEDRRRRLDRNKKRRLRAARKAEEEAS